ncbi:hypothetical protein GS682_03130 [Nostoc sp. B(2019)]|nr:hypothetical protein [Nostoc sp. B(2019)]
MDVVKRRIGLEQEFLQGCHLMAQAQGLNPSYFVPEFVKSATLQPDQCLLG